MPWLQYDQYVYQKVVLWVDVNTYINNVGSGIC